MKNSTMKRWRPRGVPHFNCKEIRSSDQIPVLLQKFLPGCLLFPLWSGLDPVPFEHASNRVAGQLVPEIRNGSMEALIAPAILLRHSDHQSFDLRRSARTGTVGGAVILLRNQSSVPSQERFWCHDGGKLIEISGLNHSP
jgi:hypothetical protein